MPNRDGFLTLAELTWPVTYSWVMSVPWGHYTMSITVDYPDGVDDPVRTSKSVIPLWKAAIAPAISFLTSYVSGSGHLWKYGVSVDGTGTFPVGENGIFPMGKEHGVAVVLHSGQADRYARRRLIFPTCPRAWIDDRGQLEDDGAGKMLTHLRGMFGGLHGSIENAPFSWLMAYPETVENPLGGPKQVGFRRVEWVRLCQYTVPCPDTSLAF